MRGLRAASIVAVAAGALILPGPGPAGAGHEVDLATGVVDGQVVLGRTPAGVRSLLGPPDFAGGTRRLYHAGWGGRDDFSLMVIYRRQEGRLRAASLVFERGPLVDPVLGNLLALNPSRFQAAVGDRYGHFQLARPYGCRSRGVCTGSFDSLGGRLHLTFGTTAQRGTFITVWRT